MKNIVLENKKFALTIGENAVAESLIYKETGEEMLSLPTALTRPPCLPRERRYTRNLAR